MYPFGFLHLKYSWALMTQYEESNRQRKSTVLDAATEPKEDTVFFVNQK